MSRTTTPRAERGRMKAIEAAAEEMAARRNRTPSGNGSTSAAPAVDDDGEYRPLMPLEALTPSRTNPRKHFDADYLAELAESIRSVGVLEPILVRAAGATIERGPLKGRDEAYEIVAGECRYRASKLAKRTTIPAVVKALTDRQARKIQLIENCRRKDLTPLEEADGYQELLKEPGATVEALAKEIGKAKTYVYARLKLTGLPETAKKALGEGTISAGVAELIARVPDEKLRATAAKEILGLGEGGEALSLREAREYIQTECMVELKGAPFNRDDPQLLPSAGACTHCPKRAGNNRELYPDARGDTCTDPACYRQKLEAHAAKLRIWARATGQRVLLEKEAEDLWDYHGTKLDYRARNKWIDLKEPCADHPKRFSFQALIGNQAGEKIVLAQDKVGEMHRLIPKAAALPLLRQALGIKESLAGDGPDDWRRQQAKRQQRERAERARRQALKPLFVGAIYRRVAELLGDAAAGLARAKPTELLRQFLGLVLEYTSEEPRALAQAIGVEAPADLKIFDAAQLLYRVSGHEILALLLTIELANDMGWQFDRSPRVQKLCRSLGLDAKKIAKGAAKGT
jgi:ParB/RepB/Spo0J family partition protein